MFGWLRKREYEKIEKLVEKRTESIVADVDRLSFSIFEEDTRVGEYNLRAKRFYTVGLSLLGLPELVSYGPVGGVTDTDLLKITQIYLRQGAPTRSDAMPRDGDRIILDDKTVTLRAMPKLHFAETIGQGLLALIKIFERDELYFPVGAMQVYASEPPAKHWDGEIRESRTLSMVQPYDPWQLSNLAAVIKRSRAELSAHF
jgi:hypothetical protein